MADDPTEGNERPQVTAAADRMRRSRDRKRKQTRIMRFEIRDLEIAALVAYGFLAAADRNNAPAIADALGHLLDLPPARWPSPKVALALAGMARNADRPGPAEA